MTARATTDELLDRVAIGLAQEVRNPLNALRLDLRILEDELRAGGATPSPSLVAVLDRIAAEVGQIDRFVGDFLRYARPPRLEREPVPVAALADDLAAFARTRARAAGVKLDVRGASAAVVDGDGVQLRQALFALAAHAIDVTPRRGAVTIELADRPGTVAIAISDGAPPLPRDAMTQAYEPFVAGREDASGLALAIARRVVESHGGTLRMEQVPGRGNCAKMSLPAPARG